MADSARATVPGHVTGFFTIEPAEDPTAAGSRGAGIALEDDVTVTVNPAESTTVAINGSTTTVEAVERVLDALDATATVSAQTDLPLGAGFGVSGAFALGTALAGAAAFDRRLSENELITVAHGAEVQADTGLGDVVAQARGGVPIRLEPGGPHENMMDAIPARSRIEYLVEGELATSAVLSEASEELSRAGKRALSELVADPSLDRFMRESRRFTRETDLLTDWTRTVIEDVTAGGGQATMGLLGETVIALGTGLSDAGYDPAVTAIDPAGATIM